MSLLTPSYNSAGTIERAMRSGLDPAEAGIESILVDGGSSDGTVDVIRGYTDRLAFRAPT